MIELIKKCWDCGRSVMAIIDKQYFGEVLLSSRMPWECSCGRRWTPLNDQDINFWIKIKYLDLHRENLSKKPKKQS